MKHTLLSATFLKNILVTKIVSKCDTTWAVICLSCPNLKPHISVLSVAKGLISNVYQMHNVSVNDRMTINVTISWHFNPLRRVTLFMAHYQLLPRFFSNSEEKSSELVENLEEMFPLYYMHDDVNNFKSSTTQSCVTGRERVKHL